MKSPLVSILILNYNGKKFLEPLFDSLSKVKYENVEILILDNNSSDKSIDLLTDSYLKEKGLFKKTSILKSKVNTGFAKGNNILVQSSKGKYLLFLNTDVILQPDTIGYLVATMEKDIFIAGVTPKTYLSRYLPSKIFDSIGICMDFMGSPYNRGIGQLDLGQYDKTEDVMGVCFACALVRRDIYVQNGGLDDSYFAYFEDVDWCFRTKKEGYKFITCPLTFVDHYHSGTSSEQSYAWKYHLIFRNYLRTVIKSFGLKNAIKISFKKMVDLLKTIVSKDSPPLLKKAMIKVLLNFIFIDAITYFLKRSSTRKRFIKDITDDSIFAYSIGEPSNFFNAQTYEPEINIEFIKHVKSRLIKIDLKNNIISKLSELEKNFYCISPGGQKKNNFRLFT